MRCQAVSRGKNRGLQARYEILIRELPNQRSDQTSVACMNLLFSLQNLHDVPKIYSHPELLACNPWKDPSITLSLSRHDHRVSLIQAIIGRSSALVLAHVVATASGQCNVLGMEASQYFCLPYHIPNSAPCKKMHLGFLSSINPIWLLGLSCCIATHELAVPSRK